MVQTSKLKSYQSVKSKSNLNSQKPVTRDTKKIKKSETIFNLRL